MEAHRLSPPKSRTMGPDQAQPGEENGESLLSAVKAECQAGLVLAEKSVVSARLRLGAAVDELFSLLSPFHRSHLGVASIIEICLQCQVMENHLAQAIMATTPKLLEPIQLML